MTGMSNQVGPVRRADGVNVGLSVRVAQMQVLSRDLAHIAHDVQNHLATINESAGWMGDLLKLKGRKRFGWIGFFLRRSRGPRLDGERLFSALISIQKQVAEASILSQGLGSFAHRLKEVESVFLGNEALKEIRHVLLRQATKRGLDLEIKLAKPAALIETDPLGFQLAVFFNVKQVMDRLEKGNWVVLETENRPGRFQVRLTSPSPDRSCRAVTGEPEGAAFAHDIVDALGGQTWEESGDGKSVTTLSFCLPIGRT